MEDSNPRWSITAPMSVFWTAAIAARRIFRVAGLRCQRTALQSKDCLRQARGDFNPDPLRRRTRCCSSSLPFDQYEIPTSATESGCCADGWGRTSSLRLSLLGGAPPVELHRRIARKPGGLSVNYSTIFQSFASISDCDANQPTCRPRVPTNTRAWLPMSRCCTGRTGMPPGAV